MAIPEPPTSPRNESTAAVLLCMAAGLADAIGFVQLVVFAANMTCNTVLLGLSLAQLDGAAALTRGATLAAFFVGAALGRALLRSAGGRAGPGLVVEAALLAGAAFVDPKSVVALWTIAAAMGIQASTIVKFKGAAVSTVVITSTMARLADWVSDLATAPWSSVARALGTPPSLLVNTWMAYASGALLAALALPRLPRALLLPAAFVLVVAWLYAGRAPGKRKPRLNLT